MIFNYIRCVTGGIMNKEYFDIAKQCVFCKASNQEAECDFFKDRCWMWLLGECPGYVTYKDVRKDK